ARQRSEGYRDRIEFCAVDATRPDELRALGADSFDGAVCTMALMDMAETAPLFTALAGLLRPGAPFVFTVTHPVFNQTGATRGREEADGPQGLHESFFVRIDRYLAGGPGLGIGIVGQPTGHWYFERPLGTLLAPAFSAGFVLDALVELACPPEMPSSRPLSWAEYRDIPPFLAIRLRSPPKRGPG
ncbi:MAG: class I SAM-dependent methyltransferase, partial [Thermoplasmata archaeon]|nr:class I SAM-dependent methyltransferase [Thermoplasmata archaeon]